MAFDELGYASAAMASYRHVRAAQARRRDPAGLPLPRLAPDAARAGQRVRGARVPGRARAGLRGADAGRGRAHPRGDPGRPARDPVGRPLRVRDAGGRDRRLVRRRAGRRRRAPAAARASWCPRASSSASTSVTATTSTATSPSPRTRGKLVGVANALAASLDRPLNWIHMPVPHERDDDGYFAPLDELRLPASTELYLGLIHAGDARRRAPPDRRGAAPRRGLRRSPPSAAGAAAARPRSPGLLELHRELSAPLPDDGAAGASRSAGPTASCRSPDEDWTNRDSRGGLAYDHVDAHGWYRNLDLTVEDLASTLHDGDLLLDYSAGTGILLDRLRLRMFDRRVGVVIVDRVREVPPRRAREVPRRSAGRAARCATSRTRRLQRSTRCSTRVRRARVHERDPSLPRPAGRRSPPGCARCAPAAACSSTSATSATRAQAAEWILDETVWVSTTSPRGSCAPTRSTSTTARRSTTSSA